MGRQQFSSEVLVNQTITGSEILNVEFKKPLLETLLNAVSFAPSEVITYNLGITNEKEIWVYINTDKQPWTVRTGLSGTTDTPSGGYCYPSTEGVVSVHDNFALPFVAFVMGNLISVANLGEAKTSGIRPVGGMRANFHNKSLEISTVTIRVLRIWG